MRNHDGIPFDGDEMNMHVPQSLQTHEELMQLASVPTQIISPRECKPIVSVVQDIALGIYRITKDNVRLTEKQLFNLLCLNPNFTGMVPKAKYVENGVQKWSGRQLLSTVIPKKINIDMKTNMYDEDNPKESAIVKIRNGEILSGTFDKDVYQARSKGLVHSIYNEYGPDETRMFFDNTQKIICAWFVLAGASVGISDLIVGDDTQQEFKNIINKMKVEVYDFIRKLHTGELKNDSTKNNNEFFESKVNDLLNNANKEVGQEGQKKIDENVNRLIHMINSKSKGNTINVAQMIGCLGQQNVDGVRIPYGFDDRTLPHYNKYDDGPESRGFVANSFITGLTPQEFFMHAMGGREGLIDTACQTSTIGYVQRKLVKAMEDCKVNQDGSVRNATGSIIQFLYGDDGMDASKIEAQPVPYACMDLEQMLSEYKFSDNLDELKAVMDPDVYERTKKQATPLKKAMEQHITQLLQDRQDLVKKVHNGKNESTVLYPVCLKRLIDITKGMYHDHGITLGVDLEPQYVLTTIDKLCKDLIVNKHHQGNKLFQILLRAYLSPKVMIVKHRIPKAGFDYIVQQIIYKFNESLAHPSEMVGVVAAQSLGEPATQLSTSYSSQLIVKYQDKMYKGTIGEFIDKLMNKYKSDCIRLEHDSYVLDIPEDDRVYIVGVSNDEKTSWKPISQVSRHPANGDLVKVYTKSGRKTTATLSHSFLKRTENGIEPIKGSDLKVGDRIPVAKYIPLVITKNTKSIDIKSKLSIELSEDFGWFLGAYIADGTSHHGRITITKIDEDFRNHLCRIVKNIFGLDVQSHFIKGTAKRMLNGYDMSQYMKCDNYFKHSDLAKFLVKECGSNCYTKRIPAWVFGSNLEFIKGFIAGYIDGDGSTSGNDTSKMTIRTSSVSKRLTQEFIQLLSFAGIFATKTKERRIGGSCNDSSSEEDVTDLQHHPDDNRKYLHTAIIPRKYARLIRETIPLVTTTKIQGLDLIIAYQDRPTKSTNQEYIDKIPELGNTIAFLGKALDLEGQSRTYGRWTKKESIGRETLESYMPIFEKGKQEWIAMGEDAKVLLNKMKAHIAQCPGHEAIITPTSDMASDMMRILSKAKCRYQGGDVHRTTFEKYMTFLKDFISEREHIAKSFIQTIDEKLNKLYSALDADVVWDEIIKLKIVKDKGELVYDFTVPGNDSFMVDYGVLVHNTLNSVIHETPMLLEIDGKLTSTSIGDFIDNHFDQVDKSLIESHPNDTWLAYIKDKEVKVQSCTKDGKIIWRKVEAVTRHPVVNEDGSDTLIKVTLQSGREVIATKGKSFLQRINNEIVPVEGKNIKVGEYLPISRVFNVNKIIDTINLENYLDKKSFIFMSEVEKALKYHKEPRWWSSHHEKEFTLPYSRSDIFVENFVNKKFKRVYQEGCVYPKNCKKVVATIPEVMELDELFGFFVGAFLAEGHATYQHVLISNNDEVYLDKIKAFCTKYNINHHTKADIKNNGLSTTLRLHSSVLATMMRDNFGKNAQTKRLPAELLSGNDTFLKALIDGYFSGDGTVSSKEEMVVMATSVSKSLITAIQLILTRYDVFSSIHNYKNKNAKSHYQKAYTLYVSTGNAKRFLEHFSLTSKSKQDKLYQRKQVKTKYTYGAFDVIPNVVLDNQQITIHRDQLHKYSGKVIDNIKEENILYDKIIKIEDVPNTHKYVYDLTVEETRTFATYDGVNLWDTFHMSGVSSASATVRGVPRLEELLRVSKNIKTAAMTIYFKDEHHANVASCETIINDIRTVRFKDIVKVSEVYFDPIEFTTNIEQDKEFVYMYKEFMSQEQLTNTKLSPWLLRMQFDKRAMLTYNLDMIQIHQRLLDFYGEDNIFCMFSDDNAENLVFRIQLNKTNNPTDDALTDIKALEYNILENIIIKGIKNIERVGLSKLKKKDTYNPLTAKCETIEEWVGYTDGSNLREILRLNTIDPVRTMTNDVVEIYEVLGIEAARQALFNEINEVLESVYVNYRHIALLVDVQTNKGYIMSIDRHGINRGDIGPLAKCSFEETTDKLIKAGIFAEFDKINGVSANIMLGQIAPCGTGDTEVLIDESKLLNGRVYEPSDLGDADSDDDAEHDSNLECDESLFKFDFTVPTTSFQSIKERIPHKLSIS